MAVLDISGKEEVTGVSAFPYMTSCRDVVLRAGDIPRKNFCIDEKGQISGALYGEVFQREKTDWNDLFSGNPMEKEGWKISREDKSRRKITGPDSMIVYKDNLFLRHLTRQQRIRDGNRQNTA